MHGAVHVVHPVSFETYSRSRRAKPLPNQADGRRRGTSHPPLVALFYNMDCLERPRAVTSCDHTPSGALLLYVSRLHHPSILSRTCRCCNLCAGRRFSCLCGVRSKQSSFGGNWSIVTRTECATVDYYSIPEMCTEGCGKSVWCEQGKGVMTDNGSPGR